MKIDSVFLVENHRFNDLYPFSVLHPQWEVRCGAFRIFEKYANFFPNIDIVFHGRKLNVNSFMERFALKQAAIKKQNYLIIDGSILPDEQLFRSLETGIIQMSSETETKGISFTHNNIPFAVYLPESQLVNPSELDENFLPRFLADLNSFFPRYEVENVKVINFLYEAIEYNAEAIIADAKFVKNFADFDKLEKRNIHFSNKSNIFIGKDSIIEPGCYLNADDGPIIIGNNTRIMANSVIIGPTSIGNNSTIKVGAKIYEKTSIGDYCKVGGEIENSIIQAYTNKQHDGFLGHSYLSEWVNLGAGTNTSDLKNTYGKIKIQIEDRQYDSERMFLGLLCGDHTKSAINTVFSTGTVCGICSMVLSEVFPPKFIPSFSFGGKSNSQIFNLEKAIQIAERVMTRRNKKLTENETKLIEEEYLKARSYYHK